MTTRSSSLFIGSGFAGLRRTRGLMDLLALYRSRRALARLDATALADIGLTPYEAECEANRPVWDVPAHWVN